MEKRTNVILLILMFSLLQFNISADEDYLTITTSVSPGLIKQGEEGVLSIKVAPKNGIRISSHPKFMIKINPNDNVSFSKQFFTASELDFETRQENDSVFLDLEKENEIRFKVKENAPTGRLQIKGEVVFTAVFKDNWSLKTYQKFDTQFVSRRNQKSKKR